jgi:two-component system NtrC family sensor kinase
MAQRTSDPGLQPGSIVPTHPGIRLLAEVTTTLSSGVFNEAIMGEVVAVLRRGLSAGRCRLWVREASARAVRAIALPGDEPAPEETERIAAAIATGDLSPDDSWNVVDLRVPLVHGGERLGLLEARVPRDGREVMARDVLAVVANVLSPLLASRELSQDLAFEVAQRAREIEDARRFIAKVIDSLPVGLYVIDRDYRIQAWNRKRETGTQGVRREDALGRQIFDVLHRQPRELLQREADEVFASGRIQVYESVGDDGRHYRITKIPMRLGDDDITHLITIGEDITEWKDVQRQIAQSEKLAAVGQLAAGVMHEINNPLATIGACIDAVSGRLEDDSGAPQVVAAGIAEYLKIMDSEVERCKRIVTELLDVSRPRAGVKSQQDVNRVVEETLLLLKHHDRFKRLKLERRLAPGLPEVTASADQLIQVFMALMLNAMDAMDDRGTLTVETHPNPERADEVVISFTDTGAGIAGHDLPKIFEPFYTTKPPGRGTGLGLSICYSIVSDHGGRIEVDSALGRGSTFRVILPVR